MPTVAGSWGREDVGNSFFFLFLQWDIAFSYTSSKHHGPIHDLLPEGSIKSYSTWYTSVEKAPNDIDWLTSRANSLSQFFKPTFH